MKKLLALIMAMLLVMTVFAGCGSDNTASTPDTDDTADTTSDNNDNQGGENTDTTPDADATGDLKYIKDKGKLVVGMTVYKPMNYKDDNGEWTGFDTEFAEAVAKELGVDVEFMTIDWNNKWASLRTKKIDVVWNGMTLTEEAKTNASCTDTYVLNAQVVVMKKDNLANYTTADSVKGLKFAVEAGSAGEDIAKENKYNYISYKAQTDALNAVRSGKTDACIIDITMAKAMTGENTSYSNLGMGVSLSEEEYAIACRKDSNLTAKINELMKKLYDDGTLPALAKKYNLTLAF